MASINLPRFGSHNNICKEERIMKKAIILLLLCLSLGLPGCAGNPAQAERQLFAMDTVMTLTAWGSGAGEALAEVETLLFSLEDQLSVTRESSLVGKLNQGQTVELTPELARLLAGTLALSQKTGGALEPCLYPVTKLWGFTTGDYRVPEPAEIQAALAQVGRLHLDGDTAYLDPGSQLDLGAVGKGWAGSQAAALLQARQDVTGALLNLGGNVQTYGAKPDGSAWTIGIQDPAGEGLAGVLHLTGTWAVVTSGGYERYFTQDGVDYCHIIDPATGYPARSGLASVTVVAEDGLTADGLSTALYVLGLEAALDYWRENRDFQAVFITDAGEIYATAGLELSQCSYHTVED